MKLDETRKRIEERRDRVLRELHPELRRRVIAVLSDLGGRLVPWEGHRDIVGQQQAVARGASEATWGNSPHNYVPALACDLVLNPDRVAVRAHKQDPEYPDLWDDESPEAVSAWADLEDAAVRYGLDRVDVKGKRDKPHVQLFRWRSYVSEKAAK
jgi:hypothetical protein